jgi:ribosomal protein L11 methyltransferase
VSVSVPEAALEAYEAALVSVCLTVGFFLDEETGIWLVEGVRETGAGLAALHGALLVAEAVSGHAATPVITPTETEGWLARTAAAFPEQLVGERFAIRGEHVVSPQVPGRIAILLDAGVAFGSGEHGSTRGCLRALELAARRKPERILDMGTGSGVLAIAAARLLRRPVLATDIEPWSVRVTSGNAVRNQVGGLVRAQLANGWRHRAVRARAPYDLVLANILARPLCLMARDLARGLAPGGTVVLAGLLASQRQMVLAAHRRAGLRLERVLREGPWMTLVLRNPPASLAPRSPAA